MKKPSRDSGTLRDARHAIAHFDKPPVVETSLGFYFTPIPQWNVAHYGLVWEKFRQDYPNPEFKPPIGEMQLSFTPTADFTHFPLRAWFADNSSTQLVQIQNGAFLRNWRKTAGTPQYQHYEEVRPLLRHDWDRFQSFVGSNLKQNPNVSRCEISYFNHLVRGQEWTDFAELPKLFAPWRGTTEEGFLAKPVMISFTAIFAIPQQVTVQFGIQPGLRQVDGKEVIQFTVTAQSKPLDQSNNGLFVSLDQCHEAAVRGFLELTTEEMQARWKRTW